MRFSKGPSLNEISIDIDSFDLAIWESLLHFKPKVVVIETNSGVMPGVLSRHNNLHNGNSFPLHYWLSYQKDIH